MKKKLIEVALPLEAINEASAKEKSMRHGHPSSLHLWWARRPLAAARAVIFSQIVDDPSSHPELFPTKKDVEMERARLFKIIEDMVKWENTTNQEIIKRAIKEIRKQGLTKKSVVYDPFSGGASIPLEAQRLGLNALGSDLNPVAVMIGKAMLEIPPKYFGLPPMKNTQKKRAFYNNVEGLAEDVEFYGEWMRDQAFLKLKNLYPKIVTDKELSKQESTVIAWIWARTVPSPDPAFSQTQVPLISSALLSSKKGKEVWLELIVDKVLKKISYKIHKGGTQEELQRAKLGTSAGKRQAFKCILSGSAITYDYIRQAGKKSQMGHKLIAIVAEGKNGRIYSEPDIKHENIALSAVSSWRPNTLLPKNPRDFKTPNYGLTEIGDLFSERQLITLDTFSSIIPQVIKKIIDDYENGCSVDIDFNIREYANSVATYLTFIVGQMANHNSTVCGWNSSNQQLRATFSRQAIPMTWDYAEVNPFSQSSGSFHSLFTRLIKSFSSLGTSDNIGSIEQADAQNAPIPSNAILSTDPPYYDNIGYAELSDFFYVWMKRSLSEIHPNLFGLLSTPKNDELIAAPNRHGNTEAAEKFFLDGMKLALSNAASKCSIDFPATIYYAFKQSEIEKDGTSSTGWATFLEAILSSGFSIVGTWPIRTEKPGRMISVGTNALANSVVIVCRKKAEEPEVITRSQFIRALKIELPNAISELQSANVSPADIPQSSIGPGIGIFSRYEKILEADDSPMTVKTALQLINSELDEFLNDLHGDFDPDTRFAATWFEQNGYDKGNFGDANSLATARGISVESAKHAGIIESSAGKVRILKREELEPDWDPNSDTRLTIWECCQHLVRVYEDGGEDAAALLIKKMGFDNAEAVKDLAYYLYDICSNKRQDAKEATSYNALISGWNDITRLADSIHDTDTTRQASLF